MNDYQEYRSYGSYISRVFALIITFFLLVLAIWFVVRLAGDEDSTLGGTTTADFDRDGVDNSDEDLFVSGTVNDSATSVIGDGESSDDNGFALSTSTDGEADQNALVAGTTTDTGLPETGADLTLVLALGAFTFISSKLVLQRQR